MEAIEEIEAWEEEPAQAMVARLSKDLRAAAAAMTPQEARYLVDFYYLAQKCRIRAENQIRAMEEEPHALLDYAASQWAFLELQIKNAIHAFAKGSEIGRLMLGQVGIGPVIAGGLLAHIDIRKAPTVGHIWRFAGLDPTRPWEKGKKRPHNGRLKTLCWKAGESFVKQSGKEGCRYGKVYLTRKAEEAERNERGEYAAQAERTLTEKKWRETATRAIYKSGKLPPGHLHERAKRYAVKFFLAHLHETWFRLEFGTAPPSPWVVAQGGHAHWERADWGGEEEANEEDRT